MNKYSIIVSTKKRALKSLHNEYITCCFDSPKLQKTAARGADIYCKL